MKIEPIWLAQLRQRYKHCKEVEIYDFSMITSDAGRMLKKLDELEAIADAAVEVQQEVGINTYPELNKTLLAAGKIKEK